MRASFHPKSSLAPYVSLFVLERNTWLEFRPNQLEQLEAAANRH